MVVFVDLFLIYMLLLHSLEILYLCMLLLLLFQHMNCNFVVYMDVFLIYMLLLLVFWLSAMLGTSQSTTYSCDYNLYNVEVDQNQELLHDYIRCLRILLLHQHMKWNLLVYIDVFLIDMLLLLVHQHMKWNFFVYVDVFLIYILLLLW